jgi:hypothetical protein
MKKLLITTAVIASVAMAPAAYADGLGDVIGGTAGIVGGLGDVAAGVLGFGTRSRCTFVNHVCIEPDGSRTWDCPNNGYRCLTREERYATDPETCALARGLPLECDSDMCVKPPLPPGC